MRSERDRVVAYKQAVIDLLSSTQETVDEAQIRRAGEDACDWETLSDPYRRDVEGWLVQCVGDGGCT